VSHRHHRWRCTRTALVLVVALLVTSLPALGGEPQSPAPAPGKGGITASAERAAKAMAPAMKANPSAARAQGQPPASTANRGTWAFFKSPVGAAILATFGVGVGYALYSTQHDRVKSPGKQ
jgi:hypothetical protein